jgi:hypothetical protein
MNTGEAKVMSTADREDDDLQRALALSMGEEGEQETGVVPVEAPHFGPANRAHYDSKTWGMMAPRSHAHEIILDPEPAHRKRKTGDPAFLRPSPAAMSLGSLITILESIPLAREALLLRDYLLPDYGADKHWWEGSAIKVSRVVDIDADPSDLHWEDVIYEAQRLVAFLGDTERACGSAEVLADLNGVKAGTPDRRMVNFLQSWQESAKRAVPGSPYGGIFKSQAIKTRADADIPSEDIEFSLLDVVIEPSLTDKGMSLYDSLDSIIWADGADVDSLDETYLDSVSDVFIMRMRRQDPNRAGTGLKVPATWYPDRYLATWKEFAAGLRKRRSDVDKTIRKLDEVQSKLTSFTLPSSGQAVDPRTLLNVSIGYLENAASSTSSVAARNDNVSKTEVSAQGEGKSVSNEAPEFNPARDQSKAEMQLRAILADIEEKLQSMSAMAMQFIAKISTALEQHKEKARHALREWSKLLTEDSETASPRPHHKYSLRGVSTDPYTIYILKPVGEFAEEYTLDARARGLQWWKLTYTDSDMSPVGATVSHLSHRQNRFETSTLIWNDNQTLILAPSLCRKCKKYKSSKLRKTRDEILFWSMQASAQ